MLAGQFIFFASVCMSVNDHESPKSIDLGLQMNFIEQVNLQIWNLQIDNRLTAFRIYTSIFQYLLLDIHFPLSFQLLFSLGCLKPKLLFFSNAFFWNDKWPDAPKVRERERWVSPACIQEKAAAAGKEGDDLCFLEVGWRGCWAPTRIVWNANISLQGHRRPGVSFITWRFSTVLGLIFPCHVNTYHEDSCSPPSGSLTIYKVVN